MSVIIPKIITATLSASTNQKEEKNGELMNIFVVG